MAVTAWLVDKSALVWLGTGPDAAEWALRIERGLVRISTLTRLQVGQSARSGADLLTVLHSDKDFELIADITGQPLEQLSAQ
jgi:predicted nucleic acid-binding protein